MGPRESEGLTGQVGAVPRFACYCEAQPKPTSIFILFYKDCCRQSQKAST
jgi:hypothetical protein